MDKLNTGFGNQEQNSGSMTSSQILEALINAFGQNKASDSTKTDEKMPRPLSQTNISFGTLNYTALRKLE